GDLGVRDVAGHYERAGQREPGPDRVSGQLGPDLVHRPGEVDPDDIRVEFAVLRVRQVLRRVGLQPLKEDGFFGDLAERLAVCRAGDGDGDRAGGPVPRQPDHPYVMAEVLATELRADARAAGYLEHRLLELKVAEPVCACRARGRQRIQVPGGGV